MSSTDISIPNTAVSYLGLSAYKAVSIASTFSAVAGIEATFDIYLKSFTQNRLKFWNPILLFHCLGTMSSLLLVFDSLTLNLFNWLTDWNCTNTERSGLSVFHDGLRVNVSARQKNGIGFYLGSQDFSSNIKPSYKDGVSTHIF